MNTSLLPPLTAGNSLLHRLDPRVKVVVVLLLIIGMVWTPENAWTAYPLLWTLVGCLAVIGQLNVWRLGGRAALALPFTLAALTLLITTPGYPLLNIAGMTITDAGLARFLAIVLKSWLALQVALLLTLTTSATDLLGALAGLGVPKTLVAIISLMYRYLFVLQEEAERLLRARVARSGTRAGMKSGGSLFWRAQVVGGMVGNLFLRSYERSERVYEAMLARGYDGQSRQPALPPLTWQALGLGSVPLLLLILIQIVVRSL